MNLFGNYCHKRAIKLGIREFDDHLMSDYLQIQVTPNEVLLGLAYHYENSVKLSVAKKMNSTNL